MSRCKHLVLAHYLIAEGNEDEVLARLGELAEASRREEGNIGYEFYRSGSEPREVLIVERYVSAQAFAAHRDSAHFEEIGKGRIIPLLEHREVEEFTVSEM